MFGGDMTYNDEFTLSLMQNRELIEINKNSFCGRELYRKGDEIVWASNGKDGVYYIGVFNTGDAPLSSLVPLGFAGITKDADAFEIWTGEKATMRARNIISSTVPPHGVRLYKITI